METWIVGSGESCDIRIDEQSVSGTHCRITEDGDAYIIEDLQSTNGTYVNGQRIDAQCRASPTDKVTLGKTVAMRWPAKAPVGKSLVITIGALPENDFVIDQPVVSGEHAVLTISSDGMFLEDLNSTNGTFVGSRSNRITTSPVGENDSVWLGNHRITIGEILLHAPGESVNSLQGMTPTVARRNRMLAIAACLLTLIIASVVILRIANRGSLAMLEPDPVPDSVRSQVPVPVPVPVPVSVPSPVRVPVSAPDTSHRDACFVVTMLAPENASQHRIGNAWAISDRTLVTSATVVDTMHRLSESGFTNPMVVNMQDKASQYPVHRNGFPTGYAEIAKKFEASQALLEEMSEKSNDAQENSARTPEEIKLISTFFELRQMMAAINIGWLQASSPIPTSQVLPTTNAVDLRPNQACFLEGYPIDQKDNFFDPKSNQPLVRHALRVTNPLIFMGKPTGWRVEADNELAKDNLEGCVAIDAENKFAGIFSAQYLSVPDRKPVLGLIEASMIAEMIKEIDK